MKQSNLNQDELTNSLKNLHGDWKLTKDSSTLQRSFSFKGFYKTMGFVNALAWEANRRMHHPDLQVSYNCCIVEITTHDAGTLTQKDFQLAECADKLYE